MGMTLREALNKREAIITTKKGPVCPHCKTLLHGWNKEHRCMKCGQLLVRTVYVKRGRWHEQKRT